MFDRQTAQLVTEKLDLNAITPNDAKAWLRSTYGIEVKGRTREQVIRGMYAILRSRE